MSLLFTSTLKANAFAESSIDGFHITLLDLVPDLIIVGIKILCNNVNMTKFFESVR